MRKMVIFNVGGALCAYADINDTKIVIDVGKSSEFNPVTDFLMPLFKKMRGPSKERYSIDQLLISHPHHDHISAISDFDKYFTANLITCPNDNPKRDDGTEAEARDKINWAEFDEGDDSIIKLREMIKDRTLPLRSSINPSSVDSLLLYWLHPKDVENDPALKAESYANNISLVALFTINGHRVLFPGDIQKEGMKSLLQKSQLASQLKGHHLKVLVAPHHGLESAFCTDLFAAMHTGRTQCLNIVSEKPTKAGDARTVDVRYASSKYCDGVNNLQSANGINGNYQRKTSQGNICINFQNGSSPEFTIIQNTDELIEWFMAS